MYDCHKRGKQGQGLMKLEYWHTGVCVCVYMHVCVQVSCKYLVALVLLVLCNIIITYLILLSEKSWEFGIFSPLGRLGDWGCAVVICCLFLSSIYPLFCSWSSAQVELTLSWLLVPENWPIWICYPPGPCGWFRSGCVRPVRADVEL